MPLKDVLNYKLIETGHFDISIYHLISIIFILSITKVLLLVINKLLGKQEKWGKIDTGRRYALYQIIAYVIWILAIAISLDFIGIKLTILLAGSAALLIGVGLGVQKIFNDFVSGIILLVERSVQVGDIVEVENDVIGKVKEIGLRTSKIITRDNIVVIIPNSNLVNDRVINWSHIETLTRFHVNIGVAYGSDVEKVKRVLLECAEEHSGIPHTPLPFVRFIDFGDSSLNFQLYFWSDHSFEIETIKSDLRFLIDKKFRENDIHIPFPQRDVYIKHV